MAIPLDLDFPNRKSWSHDKDLRDTKRDNKILPIQFPNSPVQCFKPMCTQETF
jgi:hypothetical protein